MSWVKTYKASIINQNQGGGNKKEGLPPSVGTGNLSVWSGMRRAYGTPEDRALQVCINQLGSVNPRVYQSKYCGKNTTGGGAGRDCTPQFSIDQNQWVDASTTNVGEYDICFILDRSGSMNIVDAGSNGNTRWELVKQFVKGFHNGVLQRQVNNGVLPGDNNLNAPSANAVDINDALASTYASPLHRISIVSFQTISEINITYNTYVAQLFEPGETEGVGPTYPVTETRFNEILDRLQTGASTNAHLGIVDALRIHTPIILPNLGQGDYTGPQGDDNTPNTKCGNAPQRYENRLAGAPFPPIGFINCGFGGCLDGDVVSTINQQRPDLLPVLFGATYPNNFSLSLDAAGNVLNTTQKPNHLPPTPFPEAPGYSNNSSNPNSTYKGYRNGWRGKNTILILLTDGGVSNPTAFNGQINIVDQFEQTFYQSQCASSTIPCELKRIGIGLGQNANTLQLTNFAVGFNGAQQDDNHLVFPAVPTTEQGIEDLIQNILETITITNFTQTNEIIYNVLNLNKNNQDVCLYNDNQFLAEVIPAIKELQIDDPNWKLTSIDFTGQTLLSHETLQNLIDEFPTFKDDIRSINLTHCVNMFGELIQDPNTLADGPLLQILNHATNKLINLDLSGCTNLQSSDIEILVEDGVNKTNNPNCILKYLGITGIDISSDLPDIFTQLGKNDTLEMLCAAKCEIDNTLFAQALPNLIYSNAPHLSISTLKHIVLDENKITGAGLETFVNGGVGANTLIGNLKRIFVQFQKTPVTGGSQSPPAGCLNILNLPPNTIEPNDWLPFLIYNGTGDVTQGQYSSAEIQNIEAVANGFVTTDAGTGVVTAIFAVNGKILGEYQAFAYIAGGYFNKQTFDQLASLPADWNEPGVFYINNSSCIPGKVIY